MTRDELKDNICGATHDDLLDYILMLENRTCENCKFATDNSLCDAGVVYDEYTIERTFGCNKWEKVED